MGNKTGIKSEDKGLEKVRIDKFLWAIRIFKTRSLATDACSSGKVSVNSQVVKASYQVKPEDLIEVKLDKINFRKVRVIGLVETRGSASVAKAFFEDLSPPFQRVFKEVSVFYERNEKFEKAQGRPDKKTSRKINHFMEGE